MEIRLRRFSFIALIAMVMLYAFLPPVHAADQPTQPQATVLRDTIRLWFGEEGNWTQELNTPQTSRAAQPDQTQSAQMLSTGFEQPGGEVTYYTACYTMDGQLLWLERLLSEPPREREQDLAQLPPEAQNAAVLGPILSRLQTVGIDKPWMLDHYVRSAPPVAHEFANVTEQVVMQFALERIVCMRDDLTVLGTCLVSYSTSHDFIQRWDFLQPNSLPAPLTAQEPARQ